MEFLQTKIVDVILITPTVFHDSRGFFMETYRALQFQEYGVGPNFVQENYSGSRKGVLRGLHYQINHAQGKLVRAVIGEIFDVAVDIRKTSPTFGQWIGVVLSAENKQQLWLPPGLAHGFYVISDWAEVVYKATDYYSPESERTIIWNDPSLRIQWPISHDDTPIVSTKDSQGKFFKEAEIYT